MVELYGFDRARPRQSKRVNRLSDISACGLKHRRLTAALHVERVATRARQHCHLAAQHHAVSAPSDQVECAHRHCKNYFVKMTICEGYCSFIVH